MTTLNKKDVKSPDKFLRELRMGFQWTTQHSKMVAGVVLLCLIVAGGVATKSYLDQKKEAQLQAQYFPLEKAFLDKKAALTEGKTEKATGDLEKDYGSTPADLMKIVEQAPGSKAGKMAALQVAEVSIQYKKLDQANKALSLADTKSNDLLSAMVLAQLGTLQADDNKCKEAVATWEKIINNSSVKFLHGEIRLKQALCYENLNETTKAEQLYSQVKEEEKESPVGQSANKYLKLLQAKKVN